MYALYIYTLQMWNCLLSEEVFVDAEVCQDAWTDICCQAVKQRVYPVSIIRTLSANQSICQSLPCC